MLTANLSSKEDPEGERPGVEICPVLRTIKCAARRDYALKLQLPALPAAAESGYESGTRKRVRPLEAGITAGTAYDSINLHTSKLGAATRTEAAIKAASGRRSAVLSALAPLQSACSNRRGPLFGCSTVLYFPAAKVVSGNIGRGRANWPVEGA